MRTFKKIISITACSFALLHISANQSMQATPTMSKLDGAVTGATGLAACYVLKVLWNHFTTTIDDHFGEAVRKKDLETIRRMLSRPDWAAKIRHHNINSALPLAASCGHVDIVRTLIGVGADVNTYKSLHAAVERGHIEVAHALIAAHADVNARMEAHPVNLTPLCLAAENGYTAIVRALLEAGSTHQLDWALLYAVQNDHTAIARILLEAGARRLEDRVSQFDTYFWALNNRNLPIIQMLIDHDTVSSSGNTLLTRAAEDDAHGLAKRMLANHDTHVDATDSRGRTPLQVAIIEPINPSLQTAQVLVRRGAELAQVRNLANYQNNPALQRDLERLSRERLETIDSQWHEHLRNQENFPIDLIDHCILPLELPLSQVGELLSIREAQLHQAIDNGNIELLKKVIRSRVNVNAPDQRGYTLLHKAALLEGHTSVARLLLEAGAQVDATGPHQETPLHWAAYNGHESVAQLLLAHGAQVDAINQYQETPLHKAVANDHRAVAETLVTCGAELARIRNLAAYQNDPELRRNLECLSRERLQVIDNHWRDQLHDQGLYNDITDGCILPLALPESQLNELKKIRHANTAWEAHKDLYESIE